MSKFVPQCLKMLSLSAVMLSALSACQSPGPRPLQTLPANVLNPIMAQSEAREVDSTALLKLVERIYKQNFADDLDNLKDLDQLTRELEQQGISIYNLVSANPQVREQLYPLANQKVIEEFNKPSPVDAVPPVDDDEVQYLLARLQPGDVILCGDDGSFVHAAFYLGQGQIIHALATQPDRPHDFYGVVKESLLTYTRRSSRDTFVVLRPRNLSSQDFQRAAQYALAQQGKTYDTLFLMYAQDRFYCTELVWQALQQMRNRPRVFPHKVQFGWEMVTVEDFMDSPDFQTVWERNRQRAPIGQLHRY